jgi:LAO/AO transport system kinase
MERYKKMKTKELVDKVLEGDFYGIARATRYVEDEIKGYKSLLKKLEMHAGKAHVIGITGFPGAGKSTLIKCLIKEYINLDKKVGVIAVDPTALSGGAFLGDRVRMQIPGLDPFDKRLYIRSMASRGNFGGLSKSTGNVVKILDAAGYEKIFVETVGAGQNDIDIMNLAHTLIVVVNPGMGDVQTLKGGIMEIANLYVINKADYPEAAKTEGEIKGMIGLMPKSEWEPRVYKTEAYKNQGIKELISGIEEHHDYKFIKTSS